MKRCWDAYPYRHELTRYDRRWGGLLKRTPPPELVAQYAVGENEWQKWQYPPNDDDIAALKVFYPDTYPFPPFHHIRPVLISKGYSSAELWDLTAWKIAEIMKEDLPIKVAARLPSKQSLLFLLLWERGGIALERLQAKMWPEAEDMEPVKKAIQRLSNELSDTPYRIRRRKGAVLMSIARLW